jgi:RpiR family transcriptional regulator, carbohydrate utilization regulator
MQHTLRPIDFLLRLGYSNTRMKSDSSRDSERLVTSLGKSLGGLSRKRQELIRPVLENPREFVLLSVRSLAQRLHVDPATAVRVVLGMGFASYRDFQHYLHELSISQATSLDTMHASKAKGPSLPAHVREAVDGNLQNLQRLRNSLDYERVAALAKRIYAARRILIFGGDLAAVLVRYLQYHLQFLGLPVFGASSTGETLHLAQAAGKKDLVIAVSYRRGLRQTVEGMRQARANGAYCVGITDSLISPIARFAHESFITSVESPSFGASYVAPVCLLEGILAACGYYPNASVRELLRKNATEQRQGFRWYQE